MTAEWFAIRTRHDALTAEALRPLCEEVYFPTETIARPGGGPARVRPVIPRVLFVRATRSQVESLERRSRQVADAPSPPFWVYRHPADRAVRPIPDGQIQLLRLLTSPDPSRCEIFSQTAFRPRQRVRVIGGLYQGHEGYVHRVRKNRHVVVEISGLCLVMLPYIHPDLLEPID